MSRQQKLGTQTETSRRPFFSLLWKAQILVICYLWLVSISGCVGYGQQQQQQQQDQRSTVAGIYEQVSKNFEQNPRDANARFLLGWFYITQQGNGGVSNSNPGLELLKSCFDLATVDQELGTIDPLKGFLAASLLGRYLQQLKDTDGSSYYLNIALMISKAKGSPFQDIGEICTHLQLATQLDPYPISSQAVDQALARSETWANSLLDIFEKNPHADADADAYLNEEWMGNNVPGFKTDPYIHCVPSLFPLSFYYRANTADVAHRHFKLTSLVFPKLLYTAKFVAEWDKEQQQQQRLEAEAEAEALKDDKTPGAVYRPRLYPKCIDRKIKLGVISSTLSQGHSVAEDFGGILQRLDRSVFDVTYLYVHENSTPAQADGFLTANQEDRLVHYQKHADEVTVADGAWVRRIGREIETLELDMLLYLDMTMGTIVRRLGMERLAPVQLNTHGHPVTSGHPRATIQHFVSWAEAELPYEESRTHYTEELQLIPKGKLHQYYTPRVVVVQNGNGPSGSGSGSGTRISRITGMPFDHFTRKDFREFPPFLQSSTPEDDLNLYVCMQKPFKLFPEFDELVCGILQKDPKGHAILHGDDQTGHTNRFVQRMTAAGCDMRRVHFLSSLPSHELLALYKTASVILDSYPAGGCTTTREALELGKAIVTWPARLLGGRWTLGLFNIIGMNEDTKSRLVANSKEEYISKAVELGTNRLMRDAVELEIQKTIPSLFGREEAVQEWEKILMRVSPVKHCDTPVENEKGGESNEL